MTLRLTTAAEVISPETFAAYAHHSIGTKQPNFKEMIILKARAKQFFDEYPLADWSTLVDTVGYLRARRKRVGMPWAVLSFVPSAYGDGFLPGLDPHNHDRLDPGVEADIAMILRVETDPHWIANLTLASEPAARRDLVRIWKDWASV
jgi:hypothetical protein